MAAFANGYALLIAVDENAVKKWALPDVVKDVTALEAVLTHPDRCGYETANVKVLKGATATHDGIVGALKWLQQRIAADASGDATAFLYYSGHGWRDTAVNPPRFYLVPYDVTEEALATTSMPATEFAALVAALLPRRLFVALDCCHAAGIEAKQIEAFSSAAVPSGVLMGGTGSIGPSSAKGLDTLSVGAGRAVLSSSQGTQSSYIRKDGKMSIFTYHLVEALTGHAGAPEGAREVLVSDVMSHVWRRVPESAQKDAGKEQNPDYQVSGNFPLALLLGGKGLQKGTTPPEPIEDLRSRASTIVDFQLGDRIMVRDISGSTGIAIGRNAQAIVNAPPAAVLDRAFAPLESATHNGEALGLVRRLRQEIAGTADDGAIARLIDNLAILAPETAAALTALFEDPALPGRGGAATQFVLEKLKHG